MFLEFPEASIWGCVPHCLVSFDGEIVQLAGESLPRENCVPSLLQVFGMEYYLDVHGSDDNYIGSKLGYNLLKGLMTYYRGYNPVTKYNGHPSTLLKTARSTVVKVDGGFHSQMVANCFGAVINQD